jgi:hypothetical protein
MRGAITFLKLADGEFAWGWITPDGCGKAERVYFNKHAAKFAPVCETDIVEFELASKQYEGVNRRASRVELVR